MQVATTHRNRSKRLLAIAVVCSSVAACGGGGGSAAEGGEPQSGGGGNPPAPSPAPIPGAYNTAGRVAAFNVRVTVLRGSSSFASIALPAAPTITTRITVSTAAEMAAAQGMTGVEVTFAGSGLVGTLSPRANQRWIFPAGFTLTAPSGEFALDVSGARRTELVGTGGRVVGGLTGNGHSDLRLSSMEVSSRTDSAQTTFDMHAMNNCSRVLIEGSYLYARSYALIYADCNNVIVANSEVISAGEAATARAARSDLVLWMDSRLVTLQGQQQVFRAHENSGRLAGFGLQVEGSTGVYVGPAGIQGTQVQDLMLLDNAIYVSGQSIAGTSDGNVTRGTIVGNHAFTNWETGSEITVGGGAGWLVSDNPRSAATTPPPWRRQ